MRRSVPAGEIQVGDAVLLPTQHGDQRLVVVERIPRTATIKFVGRPRARVAERAGETHWGWPPEQVVTRVRKAR